MGLDTSHNCWHGAYSSFNGFRYSLAEQIGINLNDYNGYGDGSKELEDIDHDIMPLLNHSDCDGILSVEESKRIVKGLNNILENFNRDLHYSPDFENKIIRFRDGCVDAIKNNEEVYFG